MIWPGQSGLELRDQLLPVWPWRRAHRRLLGWEGRRAAQPRQVLRISFIRFCKNLVDQGTKQGSFLKRDEQIVPIHGRAMFYTLNRRATLIPAVR